MNDKLTYGQFLEKYMAVTNKFDADSGDETAGMPLDEAVVKFLEDLIDKCKNEQALLFDKEGVDALNFALTQTLYLIRYQEAELAEALIGVESFKSKYNAAKDTAGDLQSVIKEKDAEIYYLQSATKKKDEEIYHLKESVSFGQRTCREWAEVCGELKEMLDNTKAETVKELTDRLKEKFNALQYTFVTNRKTVPVEFLQEEVTEMLHGCTTVIDGVVKEMEGNG